VRLIEVDYFSFFVCGFSAFLFKFFFILDRGSQERDLSFSHFFLLLAFILFSIGPTIRLFGFLCLFPLLFRAPALVRQNGWNFLYPDDSHLTGAADRGFGCVFGGLLFFRFLPLRFFFDVFTHFFFFVIFFPFCLVLLRISVPKGTRGRFVNLPFRRTLPFLFPCARPSSRSPAFAIPLRSTPFGGQVIRFGPTSPPWRFLNPSLFCTRRFSPPSRSPPSNGLPISPLGGVFQFRFLPVAPPSTAL